MTTILVALVLGTAATLSACGGDDDDDGGVSGAPTGLVAASSRPEYLLSLSPSLYWPLDLIHGAADQSGNGHDGTRRGNNVSGGNTASGTSREITWTDFDGTDDRIRSSYNPFTNGKTRTFVGWAYRDTNSAAGTLFSGSVQASPTLFLDSSQDVKFASDATHAQVTWSTAWPGNTQWVHWALVFNESTNDASLYINGALVSTQAQPVAYNATPGNLQIGTYWTTTDSFDGKMAHVAVFERALTAAKIEKLYAGD